MITLEMLKKFGANTEEGLNRCMNDENFYIMLVQTTLNLDQINALENQISENDLDAAFETAHALKGVYGNLSLTPLYKTVCEITEYLRKRQKVDYSSMVNELKNGMKELIDMAN